MICNDLQCFLFKLKARHKSNEKTQHLEGEQKLKLKLSKSSYAKYANKTNKILAYQ